MKLEKMTAVVAAMVLSAYATFAGGIKFEDLSFDEAQEKARKENKSLFIDIYATWCGPCKYLSNNVFTDETLGAFMNDNFICIKLDGEQPDGEFLMYEFELDSYPTMVFLSPEMKLQRKIVGVTDAESIIRGGKAVLDPKSTAIYKFEQQYASGARDRDFMQSFIEEAMAEERNELMLSLSLEYMKLYPDLDLTDELEFIIFYFGNDDLENELVQSFLKDIERYYELHEGVAQSKVNSVMANLLENAIEKEDTDYMLRGVENIYPAFKAVYPEDELSLDELKEVYLETYDERTSE